MRLVSTALHANITYYHRWQNSSFFVIGFLSTFCQMISVSHFFGFRNSICLQSKVVGLAFNPQPGGPSLCIMSPSDRVTQFTARILFPFINIYRNTLFYLSMPIRLLNRLFTHRFSIIICVNLLVLIIFKICILLTEVNGRGDPLRWPRDSLYLQKLALTSPTIGGRSVGIVRLRNTSHGV
jgi:hypothetical protein